MCKRGLLTRDTLNKVTARGHVSCTVRSKNNNGLSNLFAYTIPLERQSATPHAPYPPPTQAGNSSSNGGTEGHRVGEG